MQIKCEIKHFNNITNKKNNNNKKRLIKNCFKIVYHSLLTSPYVTMSPWYKTLKVGWDDLNGAKILIEIATHKQTTVSSTSMCVSYSYSRGQDEWYY